MRSATRLLSLTAALGVGSLAYATLPAPGGAGASNRPSPDSNKPAASSQIFPGVATAWDESANLPRMLRIPAGSVRLPASVEPTPTAAARYYLEQYASRYRLSTAALATVEVDFVHDVGRGGIIVQLQQRVDGHLVRGANMKVLLNRGLELVAISGNLSPDAVQGASQGRLKFALDGASAVAAAFNSHYGTQLTSGDLLDTGRVKADYRYYDLAVRPMVKGQPFIFSDSARALPVFQLGKGGLEPAYYVEIYAGPASTTSSEYTGFVISARDGAVLQEKQLMHDAAFTYRVWANTDGDRRTVHGPQADFHPHPTGEPDGSEPEFTSPVMITMDGFNTNPNGTFDPWLPSSATTTNGNNTNAYADLYAPDGYTTGDVQPTTTSSYTFDRTYNTSLPPLENSNQSLAAVTQLFYANNWLHDYWYDSGFNEVAGNGQASNMGRGGIEGDPVLSEGQDAAYAGERNNANMSTPADGQSPRMQMYLWQGDTIATVTTLDEVMDAGTAAFGPTTFDLTDDVIDAVDNVDPYTDGCDTISPDVAGKIALIDRGNCDFQEKAFNAQRKGAVGVIIANNVAGDPAPGMGAGNENITILIPTLSVTYEQGQAIRSAIDSGEGVTANLFRESDIERDGTIDNMVSNHEWGHYIHHRLVECSIEQCRAQSEGWGDFVAMHNVVAEDDDITGTYAMSVYAADLLGDSGYFGIRRLPYSTDFSRNGFTFRYIQDGEGMPPDNPNNDNGIENSEVHNAGEVWTTVMWEAYAALLSEEVDGSPRRSFDEARRVMADYVVAGMMMAPVEPTFTEQRDAILAAAAASDQADSVTLAEAFATRGMGTCAISPPPESTDFLGVMESYVLAPRIGEISLAIDDSDESCDNDGVLDGGETGNLTVTVQNAGSGALTDALISISTTTPGISFLDGTDSAVGTVDPFDTGVVRFPVTLDESVTEMGVLDVVITVDSATACESSAQVDRSAYVNYDDKQNVSTSDSVESSTVVWKENAGVTAPSGWSREADDDINHVFHGDDIAAVSDNRWVSPALNVSSATPFTLSFKHRHSFEFSTSPVVAFWDGGVVEISTDGGANWVDVANYDDPGYNGVIETDAGNPLAGRDAFGSTNASYPSFDTVSLDFGTTFKGKTVYVRFRIGTDEAVSDYGWDIDDISFGGITNTPFPALVDDTGEKAVIYADLDGDGYGDALSGYKACGVPEGYSANSNDCDDTSADVNPDAAESCDEIDNDCNGQVDDNPTVGNTYYPDGDGDGYGSTLMPMIACSQPAGYASVSGDCNDSAASTNPGASEVCNGQDDNCDGQPDNGAVDELTFYLDADGDGQGGSSGSVTGCTIPDGYVADGGDCNDADAAVSSSALEVCDGIDNDCSGVIDDNASDAATWYNDTDGDGVGDSSAPQLSCTQPEATSVLGGDCDDANPASYPGATELCDDLDNDCDTEIDNGVSSVESYADSDGDGYGTGDALVSCEVPEGYTQVSGDCDDANASVNPGAAEICDETDNDCDDDIDEGVAQQGPFYTDRDGDGYGSADASGTYSCTQPDGTSTNDDDCNDNNNDIYPGAAEPAGDIDYNCDGELTTENPEETSTPSTGDDDSPSGDDDSPSGDDDTAEDTPDTGGEVSPTPTTADDAGGCSCSQPSSSAPGQQAGSLMVALLGLSVLRRRARR